MLRADCRGDLRPLTPGWAPLLQGKGRLSPRELEHAGGQSFPPEGRASPALLQPLLCARACAKSLPTFSLYPNN